MGEICRFRGFVWYTVVWLRRLADDEVIWSGSWHLIAFFENCYSGRHRWWSQVCSRQLFRPDDLPRHPIFELLSLGFLHLQAVLRSTPFTSSPCIHPSNALVHLFSISTCFCHNLCQSPWEYRPGPHPDGHRDGWKGHVRKTWKRKGRIRNVRRCGKWER